MSIELLTPRSRAAVLVGLAIAGCATASYLALYQLGVVTTVWEPLFGDGSRLVLHSSLSRALPVPDAALGAVGYLVEIVCVSVRSRAPTWVSVVYRALVTVFAVVSIALLAMQWGYFHAWCTLCLTSAVLSFVIAGVVMSEPGRRQNNERQS